MSLKPELVRGIHEYCLPPPAAAQKEAMQYILARRDCVIQVKSHVNESCVYLIPMLQAIDTSARQTQAIVIASTREIAQAIWTTVRALSKHLGVYCYSFVGGGTFPEDCHRARHRPQVVVGTVGRICGLVKRNALELDHVRSICLSEADMSMLPWSGNSPNPMDYPESPDAIKDLLRRLPVNKQFVMLSANLPAVVLEAADEYMRNHVRVPLEGKGHDLDGVKQYYYEREFCKLEIVHRLHQIGMLNRAVIFCSKKERVDWLTEKLRERRIPTMSVHSGVDYEERKRRIRKFSLGSVGILITTDLLARSLDGLRVPVIINHDMPWSKADYILRVDDGGRCGGKRTAITLLRPRDLELLQEIEQFCDIEIEEMIVRLD